MQKAILILTTIILAILLLLLSNWQYQRYLETGESFRNYENVKNLPLVTWPGGCNLKSFREMAIVGRYLPEKQYLLENQTLGGKSGYRVFSPFISFSDHSVESSEPYLDR